MPEITPINERPQRIEISEDYTMTTIVLDDLITAHRAAKPSRERSLLITKLQEARMWCREAFHLDS